MIELIFIALAAIVVSIVLVWIYRKLTESRGMTTSLVRFSNDNGTPRLSQQQGFVRLHGGQSAKPKAAAGKVKSGQGKHPPAKNGGNVRTPWGW